MIEGKQVPVAAGLARALDGVQSELLKLSAVATASGLQEDGEKIGDLAVAVARAATALETKARERFIAAQQGKAP